MPDDCAVVPAVPQQLLQLPIEPNVSNPPTIEECMEYKQYTENMQVAHGQLIDDEHSLQTLHASLTFRFELAVSRLRPGCCYG